MNIGTNICLHTIGGALVGAGLTTVSKLFTTAQQQRHGALIGATSACACSLLQSIIAEVGTRFNVDKRNIVAVDVATQVVVNVGALTAFHSAELLNAPTTVLFAIVASLRPIALFTHLDL